MKKRLLYSALILLLLLCLAACNNTPAETPPAADTSLETPGTFVGDVPIEWAEPALEALVRQVLGKPEGIIFQEELDYITTIELFGDSHLFFNGEGGYFFAGKNPTEGVDLHIGDGRGNLYKDGTYEIEGQQYSRGAISSLADFANFRNLTGLDVHKNRLLDLAGLSYLNDLTSLGLWDNDIQDAGDLATLMQLEGLSLDYNNIADMSAFSGFDQLVSLSVNGNLISSLEWLSNFGFSNEIWLSLGNNPLQNLEGLENLEHLASLSIMATQIEDISVLAGNTSLHTLNLKNLKVESFDLAQLTAIPNLSWLLLQQSQAELVNFRSLAELKYLEYLYVTPNVNIADEDIAWLREQLPFCIIE